MQVKEEIVQIVDTLPDELLEDVLLYLRKVQQVPKEKKGLYLNLSRVLTEDSEVLHKLAQ